MKKCLTCDRLTEQTICDHCIQEEIDNGEKYALARDKENCAICHHQRYHLATNEDV